MQYQIKFDATAYPATEQHQALADYLLTQYRKQGISPRELQVRIIPADIVLLISIHRRTSPYASLLISHSGIIYYSRHTPKFLIAATLEEFGINGQLVDKYLHTYHERYNEALSIRPMHCSVNQFYINSERARKQPLTVFAGHLIEDFTIEPHAANSRNLLHVEFTAGESHVHLTLTTTYKPDAEKAFKRTIPELTKCVAKMLNIHFNSRPYHHHVNTRTPIMTHTELRTALVNEEARRILAETSTLCTDAEPLDFCYRIYFALARSYGLNKATALAIAKSHRT